ncbi:MAG TPA: hypothetical protein VFZ58_05095 [Candidatus Saccharimonadales bacterium]
MKKITDVSQTLQQFYWTLLLQATIFILLGLLILFYPALLFILAAVAFVMVGLASLIFAWKVRALIDKLPDFLKR